MMLTTHVYPVKQIAFSEVETQTQHTECFIVRIVEDTTKSPQYNHVIELLICVKVLVLI